MFLFDWVYCGWFSDHFFQNNQCCEWQSCHEKIFLQRRFMCPSLDRGLSLTVRCKLNQTLVKSSGICCGNLFSNWIPSAEYVGYQLSFISLCAFWTPAAVISGIAAFTHQQSSSSWFSYFSLHLKCHRSWRSVLGMAEAWQTSSVPTHPWSRTRGGFPKMPHRNRWWTSSLQLPQPRIEAVWALRWWHV